MTTRNPMNERYTSDEVRKGKTRKSAASAKPATKAAASVYIEPSKKQPQKKGFFQKLAGGDQGQSGKKQVEPQGSTRADYFNPPTEEYKRLRRIWWAMLIVAIAFTALSFVLNSMGLQGPLPIVVLVIAYASIIAALYLDFVKIRKVRQKYADEMEHSKTKAAKRERKEREAQLAAERAEQERIAAEKAAKKAEKKAARKGLFGGKKQEEGEKAATDSADSEN